MTEKMRALRALFDAGECTVLEIVDATDIPSGRAFAALQALLRDQHAVSAPRDGHARYTITEAGRDHVNAWGSSPTGQETNRV
ncbi:hypothetical protein [Actinacidiphila sp. ITFR-21]|uniref:hypothetical protein n=1 Tax=Actinacidiphila sp. ITFR-21 TaxID=3075199 RepID=UPI00288BE8BE|nr:hypothetical protein [Streptomyces sp. ITFR-21]WNI17655.1 hypothetical protein RLT57_20410 [Streptomyces sp. ITFR-21]WNI17795.1 hypothetical protein RLT57_21125 [Streptomyces sp. ITFR-21]